MTNLDHFSSRRWTRREVTVWLSASILAITLGVLAVTNLLGSWALVIAYFVVVGVAFMRYRAESRT